MTSAPVSTWSGFKSMSRADPGPNPGFLELALGTQLIHFGRCVCMLWHAAEASVFPVTVNLPTPLEMRLTAS